MPTQSSKSASLPPTSKHGPAPRRSDADWPDDKYVCLGELGEGSFGRVLEVRSREYGWVGALKVLKTTGPENRERFNDEVALLSKLSHRNVCRILDHGPDWFAMPKAKGTLASLAPELSADALLEMVRDVAEGLDAVHAQDFVHRDVTPNNILFMEDDEGGGRWVISDFGLVRRPAGHSRVPTTRGSIGTEGYMAPEVMYLGGHSAKRPSDVYSLGRCIAFATSAKKPVRDEPLPVPAAWAPLVELMTAQQADARIGSMREVLAELPRVEDRLRDERRRQWGERSQSTAKPGIPSQELEVLGLILSTGRTKNIREDDLRKRMSPHYSRQHFTIGIMGLQNRGFIEQRFDGYDNEYGVLTETAERFVLDNAALFGPETYEVAETVEAQALEMPPPVGGGEDDIPF